MDFSWYLLTYSEYSRPLVGVVGTVEKEQICYLNAYLFSDHESSNLEVDLSLQCNESKQQTLLHEFAKDRFLGVARSFGLNSNLRTPVIQFERLRGWHTLQAWRSAGAYGAMSVAQQQTKWPEMAAELNNFRKVALTPF